MEKKLRAAFLVLLRQGLWGQAEDSSQLFPLTPQEWISLYEMAVKQTVQGIVYDGISLLPVEQQPPRPFYIQWTVAIDTLERMNRQQQRLIEVFGHLFLDSAEGPIRFQVIKGQSVGCYYRNPLHRVCGDIDLYFGNEQRTEAANRRMEKIGIPVERKENGEAGYILDGVVIEHHSHLIDLHNHRKTLQEWESRQFERSSNGLHPTATHLLLSTHILKHLINEGIGLRQLCDVAMALVALHGQTDPQELAVLSRQWNIYRWNQLLYALVVKYIGLPEKYLPFPTRTSPDRLMDEIWASGNFGHGDERFGRRPEGKWKSKWHTWKIVSNKLHLSAVYAPQETWAWLSGLAKVRFMELFQKDKAATDQAITQP
ncbi:MAG: nucleotidyltransferase family protein [Bacteroides sp.]|nr:nucleotidyltransferase family protein [Bacteroides sp.]